MTYVEIHRSFYLKGDLIMGPKYEFTGETKLWGDSTLHRIRRLRDGKLGGWIESEDNLSQEGNCWVDDDAMVADSARVYGNAKVSLWAKVYNNAQVYGNANVSAFAEVYDNAKVYDAAHVDSNVKVYGHAKVYGRVEMHEHAQVYDNSEVYGRAYVYGKAQVYGNAQVYDNAWLKNEAKVYDNAKVYGGASVYGIVYGNAEVYGNAKVRVNAEVSGYTKVDYDLSGTVGKALANEFTNENIEVLKDFIYKIDDSSKLDIQTNYDSVDAFFEDNSTESYSEHECIKVISIDTNVPLVKLEKTQVNDKNVFRFIVDITSKDGDDYIVRSVIDSKDKFDQLLKSTVDALKSYSQFSKYAGDIENCL